MNKKDKKYAYFLASGLICFAIGQTLSFTKSDLAFINFSAGLFMGLSIPLNIYGLYGVSKNLNKI